MKVSILTASFNSAKYIKPCVRSALTQTHEDLEMIIVDDRSEDASVKTVRQLAASDKRIRFIRAKKKLLCSGAYNLALREAKGDICCVLDSDDALADNSSVAQLVSLYENNEDVGYIYTQFHWCDKNLRKTGRKGTSAHPGDMSLLECGFQRKHCFSHWRTMRTELREKEQVFRLGLQAAVDKWMGYVLEELAPGGFYDVPLYLYRQRKTACLTSGPRARRCWKTVIKEASARRRRHKTTPYPIRKLG